MHWFWRGVIATASGCTLGTLWFGSTFSLFTPSTPLEAFTQDMQSVLALSLGDHAAFGLVWMLPPIVFTVLVYGLITRHLPSRRYVDGDLRCRKCNYILRGLIEPRCPECGERL